MIVVVTVIEALRAFDIVYVINNGRNGLELLSVLVTDNIIGEASRIGYGSAIAVILIVISIVPIVVFVLEQLPGERAGMTTVAVPPRARAAQRRARSARSAPPRIVLHAFLIVDGARLARAGRVGGLHLVPARTPTRPTHGYVSLPHALSLDNYRNAWTQGQIPLHFWNSMIITLPAIVLILLFASSVAFVVSRFSFWFNVPLLIFFMAANLLPQQVIITPLYELYLRIHLPTWISSSGLALRLLPRADRDQRRLPDRLLHVRALELHEDDPEVARPRRRASTAPASRASSSGSSCRSASRRSPRSRRSSSPGSTTTSSGRSC